MKPSVLTGKQVANTRALHQAEELDRLLYRTGAIPISYPCLAIAPPENSTSLDVALCQLAGGRFDWLVLTSSNTVLAIQTRLQHLGLDTSVLQTRTG